MVIFANKYIYLHTKYILYYLILMGYKITHILQRWKLKLREVSN